MKTYIEDFKKMYFEERWMLILIIFNLIASIALFVFGIIKLSIHHLYYKWGLQELNRYC